MWANTCWGFLSLAVTFVLARLSMIWTAGHEEWGPRFIYAAIICGILSGLCFFWPLFKRFAIDWLGKWKSKLLISAHGFDTNYPAGTKIGGIVWSSRFSQVLLEIINPTDDDYKELDISF